MRTRRSLVALGAALGLLVAGCSAVGPTPVTHPGTIPAASAASAASQTHHDTSPTTAKPAPAPLRDGEKVKRIAMPATYLPKAPSGGTDDYRCFLLDPKLTRDSFVTGYDVEPGDASIVHHVILYRVPASKVGLARAKDAQSPGDGWTCFGGTGIEQQGASLDDAPWVGAWAPGGKETVLSPDLGIPLDKGSQLILQVHYNLLNGPKPDRTAVDLRLSTSAKLTSLETVLYPAPVELPCRPGKSGPLCHRDAAVWDVAQRFGDRASWLVAGLLMLCEGAVTPHPGPTQSCTRTVDEPAVVRASAGHMHLLGSSIRIELNAGTPKAKTLLDINKWDFDDQGSRPLPATPIRRGDRITVTCTHDQAWRDKLPALQRIPERYVVWGEGTTDEMCLGILSVTRS
jgi:copper type II ascorbate-dependent monooxygenase-like protein